MIYGIGTDIVEVVRIERALNRYGEGFAKRVLSADEWSDYLASGVPERFIAKRFAAKEAFAKALGLGMRAPATWQNISVKHDALGKPELSFHPKLRAYLTQNGVDRQHLSISDEKQLATAFVVLERGN